MTVISKSVLTDAPGPARGPRASPLHGPVSGYVALVVLECVAGRVQLRPGGQTPTRPSSREQETVVLLVASQGDPVSRGVRLLQDLPPPRQREG